MDTESTATTRRYCSACGTRLDRGARFCSECGAGVGQAVASGATATAEARGGVARPSRAGIPVMLLWGVPALSVILVLGLVAMQRGSRGEPGAGPQMIPLSGMSGAPDISAMTPAERADRLFNRVMRLSSEGHPDSAAFFGDMALGAFDALAPLTPHLRYDMGLVALVTGKVPIAQAQADSILAERPTHLLGLSLAARAADARNDGAAAAAFRRRLLASEAGERAANLPEYTDHESDVREAIELARRGGRSANPASTGAD